MDQHNVVWDSPSEDCNGSMPIGNGDIGMNVWAERDGNLLLLLSKTDAWCENCRLVKLGRVRVKLSPNPFAAGLPFNQVLRLSQGEILIEAGQGKSAVTLRIWVDANQPVIRVEADSPAPFEMKVALEVWRNKRREMGDEEADSAYGLHNGPSPVTVYPDTVLRDRKDQIVWYHRNETSLWADNLKHQGLEGFIARSSDPLLHRTFGGCIEGAGLASESPTMLRSEAPKKRFILSIYPLYAQTESAAEWVEELSLRVASYGASRLEDDRARHRAWWSDFWNRSWIRVTGSPDAEAVTRGYVLQRWINACAGRGAYPIKFNGTIFNVDGKGFDADYRAWGGPYWWQNTRLAYWPMLACGDFDMMLPMFRMYQDMLPLSEYRTQVWHGHSGAFIGETVYFWGMYVNANYGWKRPANLPIGELVNPYIHRHYNSSLELMTLMLEYCGYTSDRAFLLKSLLPACDSLLAFWDQHYVTDEKGRMKMHPAQSLETWQDVVNPTPDVAGLHWVLGRLLALPKEDVGPDRRAFWTRLSAKLPPVPVGEVDGQKRILPAETVSCEAANCENPELYAVFPFRLFGVGRPDLEVGRATFAQRQFKGNSGWDQDDVQAALLGLAETAADCVAGRAKKKHEASRFPAFWGPNYDWVPDQDHGGNLMIALQAMLLQADDGRIRLLPAWPKEWDVEFKLHAPGRTVVAGSVKNGKPTKLDISPESRRKDVIVLAPQ
jgi:alpha-L-fucosidase 2